MRRLSMLCRHLCGCVTWHGDDFKTDVYTCDAKQHSGSYYTIKGKP